MGDVDLHPQPVPALQAAPRPVPFAAKLRFRLLGAHAPLGLIGIGLALLYLAWPANLMPSSVVHLVRVGRDPALVAGQVVAPPPESLGLKGNVPFPHRVEFPCGPTVCPCVGYRMGGALPPGTPVTVGHHPEDPSLCFVEELMVSPGDYAARSRRSSGRLTSSQSSRWYTVAVAVFTLVAGVFDLWQGWWLLGLLRRGALAPGQWVETGRDRKGRPSFSAVVQPEGESSRQVRLLNGLFARRRPDLPLVALHSLPGSRWAVWLKPSGWLQVGPDGQWQTGSALRLGLELVLAFAVLGAALVVVVRFGF